MPTKFVFAAKTCGTCKGNKIELTRELKTKNRIDKKILDDMYILATNSVIHGAYVKLEGADYRAGPQQIARMQHLETETSTTHRCNKP